jgi:putative transposase
VLSTETITARPVFERAVREYGLPRAIRTDNGVPFATQAIHGLSYLNVCSTRGGCASAWSINASTPAVRKRTALTNGCTAPSSAQRSNRCSGPAPRSRSVSTRFDAFRLEYTTERPHEALGQETPASRYRPAPRPYPTKPPVHEYPGHYLVKRVTDAGTFRFQQRLLYIANALVDEYIGLEETDDGVWTIYFNTVLIATLDERDFIIRG